MLTAFDLLSDGELIAALQQRGYSVRHNGQARRNLSWSRVPPLPPGVDFKAEAVERLREQITEDLVQFIVEPAVPPRFTGDRGRPETYHAVLHVL